MLTAVVLNAVITHTDRCNTELCSAVVLNAVVTHIDRCSLSYVVLYSVCCNTDCCNIECCNNTCWSL